MFRTFVIYINFNITIYVWWTDNVFVIRDRKCIFGRTLLLCHIWYLVDFTKVCLLVCVCFSSSTGVIVDACRGGYVWSEGMTWSFNLHFSILSYLLCILIDTGNFAQNVSFHIHFWLSSLLNPICMFIPNIFSL